MELEEAKLIAAVEKRPALYDKYLADYKKPNVREFLWKEVAEEIEADEYQCKKRWRSLRDTFKKLSNMMTSSSSFSSATSSGKTRRRWAYFDTMSFLTPFIGVDDGGVCTRADQGDSEHERDDGDSPPPPNITPADRSDDPSNDESDDAVSGDGEPRFSATPGCRLRIARDFPARPNRACAVNKRQRVSADDVSPPVEVFGDADRYFLLSLLPSLRRLTPHQNSIARMRIQQVLYEVEYKPDDVV